MLRTLSVLLLLGTTVGASAGDFSPRELNVFLGGGKSPINTHGHSVFRTIELEVVGHSRLADRWIRNVDAGVSLSYSDVRQARSWFGYQFGEPDDRIRAEALSFFLRKPWRSGASTRPFVEIGTGPMWSNRRIPAATSRINFQSQLGFGLRLGANSSRPLLVGYRFAHISNGGITPRNPGINVHSFWVGTRVRTLGGG
ncbi:MAG: Lipid 3-O-deacylase-related protein [Acidobacteria bacterium]|nr:Lipid 3-O-deacylase-related protein [Acidobacteriota bacterium]